MLLTSPSTPSLSQNVTHSSAGVNQVLGANTYGELSASTNGAKSLGVASPSHAYVDYAVETANKVANYQWDTANSGYYSTMAMDWTSVPDSSKQLTFKYWALAWFWLYDRTGNATYLSYAVNYLNTLVNKAWSNGFYDSYTNTWTPNTNLKSAAGNGITLWELSMAYARTGNKVYYTYANKTANWVIDNLWDSNKGCFWENTATVGTQIYVEGCSDVIIGLMSLYAMNNNQTYLGYISKSANFIISAWDGTYGGFYARVDATGSCNTIPNGCNKYPNENTWPIIALSYYYRISGDSSSKSYANKGVSYINSTLWDWNSAYNGGLFRSLYQNNTIRDNTKTAWDNCGEPWMIWVASENVGGNSTYQTLARRILNYCVGYLHDSVYGGFFTEVDRNGTTVTFSTKDAESISDSIASLSLVGAAPVPATIPYLSLSIILANRLHAFMLNSASQAYYYQLSDNWRTVITPSYSTLGNAFITLGMLQLYQATANKTYLTWASSNAESFWRNGWDTVHGGFYDTYSTSWKYTTCQQTTQPNALFELDFLRLASANGSAVWLQRANAVENLLNLRFWSTSSNVVEQSYNVCAGTQSGDVQIEVSIGSYLWATSEWARDTSLSTYAGRMAAAASFAERYLWDGNGNPLPGGAGSTGCGTTSGYLGFMRSAYADLSSLEDCRKGANENVWGAMGLAELYNTSASSTLLQFTSQDLAWVNRTLWDPTNGGYHQDTYRNDTLRSACSSTNDPRDYPGWTEGELPMFWWQIGQLTGNATEIKWASVPEQWTAKHQWNGTNGNGGEMTCLNSNTLPDLEQTTLYDWLQGSALYTYSTVTSSVGTGPTVVQPLTVTILESGAPAGSYTVNGCSASPITGTTGPTTSFTMSASCSFTISFTSSGGTRWGFIRSGAFSAASSSQLTCSSGTCSPISFKADYQAQLKVNGGNDLSYSLASETSDGWYKYGDSLTVSTSSIWNRASGVGTRLASWNLDGGSNTNVLQSTTFTTSSISMTAAHTVNFNPVTQYQITVNAGAGGTATATTPPTISGDSGWYDSGTSVQVSASANSGYSFSSWTGSGSGSYSGSNNPATVTMSAAITETAAFSGAGGSSLALDGSHGSVSSCGPGSTSCSAGAFTTTHTNDVIVAACIEDGHNVDIYSTPTDSVGLTWTSRAFYGGGSGGYGGIHVYYAVWSSHGSITVTCHYTSGYYNEALAFAVSGANTAAIWDSNPGLPARTTESSSKVTSESGTISTSNANDLVFAISEWSDSSSSGTCSQSGVLTGSISCAAGNQPRGPAGYAIVTSAQSGATYTLGYSKSGYAMMYADAIVGGTSSPSTVSQPIKVTLQSVYGGSTQTITIGGSCSPSPSTFPGDGSVHSITMNPGCAFTLSVPGGYQITGGTGTTTCASGTCTEYDTTYEASPVTQPIAATFVTTYGGSVQTLTIGGSCAPSPSTLAGDGNTYAVTMAPNCPFTLSVPSGYQIVTGGSSTSCASGTCTTYTATTYELSPPPITEPISVGVLESGAPGGTYAVNGCSPSPTTGSTGTTTSFTMNANCAFTISFSNSGGTRDGFISGGTFSATSGSQSTCSSGTCPTISLNADYQALLTINGGNGVSYSLTSETSDGWYKYGDSLTVSSNGIWGRASGVGTRVASWNVDGGSNTNVATTGTVTTSSVTMTAAHTVNFNPATQYQLTLAVSPSGSGSASTSTSPTISGDTGWYDSGTGVAIAASANSGYTFTSWSGSGSGSYSGSSNPTSATMNAPIVEAATFTSTASSPQLDGSGSNLHCSSSSSSCSETITTSSPNDVIVVLVSVDGTSSNIFSTPTSSPSLTFTLRQFYGSVGDGIGEYYAVWTGSGSITVAISHTTGYYTALTVFGVSGANTVSPFDSKSGLPVDVARTGAKVTSISGTISTSNANDFIFAISAIGSSSGSGTCGAGGILTTTMSCLNNNQPRGVVGYATVSSVESAQAVTLTYSNPGYAMMLADAIQ